MTDGLTIGTHLSTAKGYLAMGRDALHIGANTLQFFARNPRGARAKKIDYKDMEAFRLLLKEHGFAPVVAHAPYTMNPCSKDPHLRNLSRQMVVEDLERMELIPGNLYNFHPGSHVGQGVEAGIDYIADMLNRVLFSDMHTIVLLETMAGKGSEVGQNFEELARIIEKVELQDKIGVCMDSCHMWDAGYDVVLNLDGVLEEFDRVVGLNRLKAFHVNDSCNGRGSHKDRHAMVGDGYLGRDAILSLLRHPRLKGLPFLLETPTDLEGHGEEIRSLKADL